MTRTTTRVPAPATGSTPSGPPKYAISRKRSTPGWLAGSDEGTDRLELEDTGPASAGTDAGEIVIAVGPAFGCALHATLLGLPHGGVLAALIEGIRREGMRPRVVRIRATSDCGFIGHAGARLSGSGVAIGIQSKGTP